MTSRIGLYYPYIHVRDDNWLKLAALYWDRLGRIVPETYPTRDSRTARVLVDELDFLRNVDPSRAAAFVATHAFLGFVQQNADKLRERYSLSHGPRQTRIHRLLWNHGRARQSAGADPSRAYVHAIKIDPALRDALIEEGLAELFEDDWGTWLGMDHHLAAVHMIGLAGAIAASHHYQPVTDLERAFLASPTLNVDTLARLLLDDAQLPQEEPSAEDIERRFVALAFEQVVPADLERVDVKKIVALRRAQGTELAAFQQQVHAFAQTSALHGPNAPTDPGALHEHLQVEYDKSVRPQLRELERLLHAFHIPTAVQTLVVGGAVDIGADTVMKALEVPTAAAVGAAVAMHLLQIRESRSSLFRSAVQSSPYAYLFFAQEALQPANAVNRLDRLARKSLFGV